MNVTRQKTCPSKHTIILCTFSSPSSKQSVQSQTDVGTSPTDACGLHKKQKIQVMHAQNPQGAGSRLQARSQPELPLLKLIKYTRDL